MTCEIDPINLHLLRRLRERYLPTATAQTVRDIYAALSAQQGVQRRIQSDGSAIVDLWWGPCGLSLPLVVSQTGRIRTVLPRVACRELRAAERIDGRFARRRRGRG